MANFISNVDALHSALQKVELQLLPIGIKKKPKFKEWQKGHFTKEEILKTKPIGLGIRMGDNGFQTVDVDTKNAENPEEFKKAFLEGFKESGLDKNKFIFQTTQSGGFHLVYRTGLPTKNKKIARDNRKRTLIEIIKERMYIYIYDEEAFYGIKDLESLTDFEYHTLLSLCYSFDCYDKKRLSSNFREYNETHTCSELLTEKGWSYVGTDSLGELWLRDGDSSQTYSAKIYPNNRCYVFSTSTPLPTGEALSPTDITTHYDYNGNLSEFGKSLSTRLKQQNSFSINSNRFRVEPLNELLERNKDVPPAKQLFGEFWHEGELCVLFGQTNTGKTILALQIAIGLATGKANSEYFNVESPPIKLLYFDLEMSDRQVSSRLKGLKNLSSNILRVDYNPEYLYDSKTSDSAFIEIAELIKEHQAEAVIFDNLSVLQPNNEKASEATELLNNLNGIKRKHGIPILAIGHTPKLISGTPIEITHLQGSAQMGNLIDSAFAIGKTSNSNQRYLKQVKVREKEFKYDAENVLLVQIVEDDEWLHLKPVEQVDEYEVLSYAPSTDYSDRNNQLYKLHLSGVQPKDLQEQFGLSKSRYYEIIKDLKESSPVEDVD